MDDPSLDVLAGLAVPRKESLNEFADPSPDHFGHVLGEENVEAGVAEVKTHRAEGIRESIGFGDQYLGAGLFLTGEDDGGGAITEENRRDEVGLGNVLALERKRRQFQGERGGTV